MRLTMLQTPEEFADLALEQKMYFQLHWRSGSPMTEERSGGKYMPSDALRRLNGEFQALEALAKRYDFSLPLAEPINTGVKLPAIPIEWVSAQLALTPVDDNKTRFDSMIRSLLDASNALQRSLIHDIQSCHVSHEDKDMSDFQEAGTKKIFDKKKIGPLEDKVLVTLAKSALYLGAPSSDGDILKIEAPPLLILTRPTARQTTQPITICGIITFISPHLRSIIIDDKFFVRNYRGPDPVVGHEVRFTAYTTVEIVKLDVVDWVAFG